MRRALITSSALLCLFFSAAWSSPGQTVSLFESEVDFGTLRQGSVARHTFTIGNVGHRPLNVELLGISHPGIRVGFSESVPAGEAAPLRVEWDTSAVRGPNRIEIAVRLDDPERPLVVFQLVGDVVPPVEFLPLPAVYISTFRDEQKREVLVIRNNDPDPLSPPQILAPEWAVVDLDPIEAGFLWELGVTLLTDRMESGFLDEWIEIVWTDGRPARRIPIHAFVKDEVWLNPEAIEFGEINAGLLRSLPGLRALTTQTFLLNRRSDTFEVLSATSDLSFVAATFTPPKGARVYHFSVAIDPELAVPGPFEGTLRIQTDDPDFPELSLPVSGAFIP